MTERASESISQALRRLKDTQEFTPGDDVVLQWAADLIDSAREVAVAELNDADHDSAEKHAWRIVHATGGLQPGQRQHETRREAFKEIAVTMDTWDAQGLGGRSPEPAAASRAWGDLRALLASLADPRTVAVTRLVRERAS